MNLMNLAFYPVEKAIEYVVNVDYGLLALKAVVKTVEIGIDFILWAIK